MKTKTILFSFLIVIFALASVPAFAQTAQARPATVVAVSMGARTTSQRGYNVPTSHTRAIAGSAIGALAAGVLSRHSRYVYGLGAVGGAIGYAVGASADRRASESAQQGIQVVVKMKSGRTVAIFISHGAVPSVGEKVWLIGNDELLPRQ